MKKKILSIVFFAGFIACLFLLSCSTPTPVTAQTPSGIQQKVEAQSFTFIAESVSPLRGSRRFLSSSYDVYISKDSLVSFLPYFGRASVAPINRDGGIKFTSTRFTYAATHPKNDRWLISITPHDNTDVQQMNFTIFDNGKGNLEVFSNVRDPITFDGRVK